MDSTTYTARITPAIAADWDSRLLADNGAPYDRIDGPGDYTLTASEAAEVLAEAAWQADPDGPGASHGFGTRQAFSRLASSLRSQGAAPPPPATIADPPPAAPRPTPTPAPAATDAVEDVRPGSIIERCDDGTRWWIDTDQDDAPRLRVWAQPHSGHGNALPHGTEVRVRGYAARSPYGS